MKTIIETHTGDRWGFSSLKAAKEAGALRWGITLADADKIEVENGQKVAVYR
jgi:hypothetical protein